MFAVASVCRSRCRRRHPWGVRKHRRDARCLGHSPRSRWNLRHLQTHIRTTIVYGQQLWARNRLLLYNYFPSPPAMFSKAYVSVFGVVGLHCLVMCQAPVAWKTQKNYSMCIERLKSIGVNFCSCYARDWDQKCKRIKTLFSFCPTPSSNILAKSGFRSHGCLYRHQRLWIKPTQSKSDVFFLMERSPKLGAANRSPSDGGLHSGSAILQRFRGRPLWGVTLPAPL